MSKSKSGISSNDDVTSVSDIEIDQDNKANLTVINTNARSLCPKMSSLIDCFSDLTASLGVVTETWLTDGEGLDEDVEDLALGAGIRMICKNREVNNRGFSHGGVAILFREAAMVLKEVKLHNPSKIEVVMAAGSVKGCPRRIAVIACYICLLYTSPSPRDS